MEFIKLNSGSSNFFNITRVLASQAVLLGHLFSWLNIFPKLQPPYLPHIQSVGVVVFFILSGFLIPYSTVLKVKQNPNYSFKDFFIERFSRIYVSLLPCILIVLLIDFVCVTYFPSNYEYYSGFNFKNFVGNLLMLENNPFHKTYDFTYFIPFGSARPFWTLAIEWWIYFWFGYLYLVIFLKNKSNLLNIIILILFSIVPFYNFMFGMGGGLFLPWCLGVLIFMLWPFFNKLKNKKTLIVFLIITFLVVIFYQYRRVFFLYVEPYFVMYLAFVMMLGLIFFHSIKIGPKMSKVIQYLADYSFTLYLLHYSFINLFTTFIEPENKILFMIISFVSINVISAIVANFTEMNYKKFRSFLANKFIRNE